MFQLEGHFFRVARPSVPVWKITAGRVGGEGEKGPGPGGREVCSVQYVVYSVQSAVYRQCAGSVQYVVCSVQSAVCRQCAGSVQCAVCSVQCAVCSQQCSVGNWNLRELPLEQMFSSSKSVLF